MNWFDDDDPMRDTDMPGNMHHLPKLKQQELERIAEILKTLDGVEMVILFGSYARGDWKEEEGLEPKRWSGHASDYDILVVTREPPIKGFEQTLREITNAPGFSARVAPIVHDIEDINTQLGEGHYFFLDIKREGRMLYTSRNFSLAEPRELTPEEQRKVAEDDFDHCFNCASRFYRYYEVGFEEGDLRGAVFNLNQATESAYKAILLVFTGHCPQEHLLELLGQEASKFGPVFRKIFPVFTEDARNRFALLDHAYIGARYKKGFTIFWGDIDYLAPRVKKLLEITEEMCRRKIESMTTGGE